MMLLHPRKATSRANDELAAPFPAHLATHSGTKNRSHARAEDMRVNNYTGEKRGESK
jgi:hypothetical protein